MSIDTPRACVLFIFPSLFSISHMVKKNGKFSAAGEVIEGDADHVYIDPGGNSAVRKFCCPQRGPCFEST